MKLNIRQKLLLRIADGWPTCEVCKEYILFARLEALPDTTTCEKHSKEGKYIGVPLFSHKTAPTVAMVKEDKSAPDGKGEAVRMLMRGYKRGR